MLLRISSFKINVSFPAVALISIVVLSSFYTDYLLCLAAVIIHESGHLAAMIFSKNSPEGIEIRAFEVKLLKRSRYNTSYINDMFIIASGPVINIIIYFIFFSFNNKFALINLFVGLFNLLPASSLDGGQLLFLLLTSKLSFERSAKIVDIITLIISLPIFFIGLIILFNSKYNYSILFIGLYLFLSFFIKKEKYL